MLYQLDWPSTIPPGLPAHMRKGQTLLIRIPPTWAC